MSVAKLLPFACLFFLIGCAYSPRRNLHIWIACYNDSAEFTTPMSMVSTITNGINNPKSINISCHGGIKEIHFQETFGAPSSQLLFTKRQLNNYHERTKTTW